MPICWPSSPITRISRARTRSFVRIKRLSIQTSVYFQRRGMKNYSMAPEPPTEPANSQLHINSLEVNRLMLEESSSQYPQVFSVCSGLWVERALDTS